MIIDIHCHIGSSDLHSLTVDDLISSMDSNKISAAACFAFTGSDDELIKSSLDILRLSKQNKRIIPFLRVNPLTINPEECKQLLFLGFKGVKLHPYSQKFFIDNSAINWLYAFCEEKDIPILFHTYHSDAYSNPELLFIIAERFPHLKIIAGHFFGVLLPIIRTAKKYPNLYADTSILPSVSRIQDIVHKYEFTNLVFGSDIPYDSQKVALTKIYEAKLDKELEERILFRNAVELLKL